MNGRVGHVGWGGDNVVLVIDCHFEHSERY